METTTTEEDPETQERYLLVKKRKKKKKYKTYVIFTKIIFYRVTRTVQVITTTSGTASGPDELRESMQKIVDRFMMEERRDQ